MARPKGNRSCARRLRAGSAGQPENVLVLAGAQQGLDLLARCLIDPGDTVVVDRPGYVGAIHTFRAAGARLVGWDVVRHDLDELEDHLLRYRPKLIYTNPTFHNPTGWTMPIRVRRDLLALASAAARADHRGRHVPRAAFHVDAAPALAHSLDTQSVVIHLSSFSKVLAPGLRLGWLSAAKPIVEQLAIIKQRADLHTQNLAQYVIADLLEDGTFDRAPRAAPCRTPAPPRRAGIGAAASRRGRPAALDAAGGRALLLVPPRRPAAGLARVSRARWRNPCRSSTARAFYVDRAGERELRLCFSTVPPARADEAARRLRRALAAARRETAPPSQLVAVV